MKNIQENNQFDSLSELYSPALRAIAAPVGLNVANLDVELTEEQIKFFGFKSVLTAEDALKVLLYLQTQAVDKKLLEKIALLYQHLAAHSEKCLQNQEEISELMLLNETNQFLLANQLYAFLVAEQDIQRYTENALFVKKPHNISQQEFKTVCKILGIKTITKASLKLEFESNDENHESISTSLNDRVTLIVLLIILKEQGIDHVEDECIQTQLVKLRRKIDSLTSKPANKIMVNYDDIFSQDLRAWLVNNILYYKTNFERRTQNAICQQLLQYLDLQIDLIELANVIFDDKDAWLAERGDKINVLHQRIVAGLSLVTEVENKKKRARPEDKIIQSASQKQSFANIESSYTQTTEADKQNTVFVEMEEPAAKRPKHSETTFIAASPVSEVSSELEGENASSEDSSEEEIVTQTDKTNRKRTFTESGLDVPVVLNEKYEISKPKRIKPSETLASSNDRVTQVPLTLSSALTHSSVTSENTKQRTDFMEVDSSEEEQEERTHIEKTNSSVVSSSSNATNNKFLPQSFFGSQGKKAESEAKSSTVAAKPNRTVAQIAADKQQGWLAEEYIFKKLKVRYSNHKECQNFVETDDGFKVTLVKKSEDGNSMIITKHLVWHNKNGESGNHVDMTLTTHDYSSNEIIKKQVIEVKSNAGSDSQQGIFSELEMNILETEKNYIIWHVGNMRDEENITDRKIKNPKQLISQGQITKREEKVVRTILNFSSNLYKRYAI